jgi:hypothetical protein
VLLNVVVTNQNLLAAPQASRQQAPDDLRVGRNRCKKVLAPLSPCRTGQTEGVVRALAVVEEAPRAVASASQRFLTIMRAQKKARSVCAAGLFAKAGKRGF